MPKSELDAEPSGDWSATSVSRRKKVLLYATPLLSGGVLAVVIYLLRRDTFQHWEKALVDLFMVTVAVIFFVSLYMAADSFLRGVDRSERARSPHGP